MARNGLRQSNDLKSKWSFSIENLYSEKHTKQGFPSCMIIMAEGLTQKKPVPVYPIAWEMVAGLLMVSTVIINN